MDLKWAKKVLNRPDPVVAPTGMPRSAQHADVPEHIKHDRLSHEDFEIKKKLDERKREEEYEARVGEKIKVDKIRMLLDDKSMTKWDKFSAIEKFMGPLEAMKIYKRAYGELPKKWLLEKPKPKKKLVKKAGEPAHNNATRAERSLADSDVIMAREMIKYASVREIAKLLNVKPETVNRAVKGITYKHLNRVAPPQK